MAITAPWPKIGDLSGHADRKRVIAGSEFDCIDIGKMDYLWVVFGSIVPRIGRMKKGNETLASLAIELVSVLESIVSDVKGYLETGSGGGIARYLDPGNLDSLVFELRDAIHHQKDREAAKRTMAEIKRRVDQISVLESKAGLQICRRETLSRYHDLYMIFQETRFAKQSL